MFGFFKFGWSSYVLAIALCMPAAAQDKRDSRKVGSSEHVTHTFFKTLADDRLEDVAKAIEGEPALVSVDYEHGGKPLYWSAFYGHEKIAAFLLEKGADVDARGIESATPLYEASFRGHTEVIKLLLEHKAEIEAVNRNGHSPLYAAVSRGHEAVVQVLLEGGANPNGPPAQLGRFGAEFDAAVSPLLSAVRSVVARGDNKASPKAKVRHARARRIAERLIAHPKAELNRIHGNQTLIHIAAQAGDIELTRSLLELGADPDVPDGPTMTRVQPAYLNTALHYAAAAGHSEVMDLLEEHGAKPWVKNSWGQKPADLLREKRKEPPKVPAR